LTALFSKKIEVSYYFTAHKNYRANIKVEFAMLTFILLVVRLSPRMKFFFREHLTVYKKLIVDLAEELKDYKEYIFRSSLLDGSSFLLTTVKCCPQKNSLVSLWKASNFASESKDYNSKVFLNF